MALKMNEVRYISYLITNDTAGLVLRIPGFLCSLGMSFEWLSTFIFFRRAQIITPVSLKGDKNPWAHGKSRVSQRLSDKEVERVFFRS